jgi:hypothetical protein
VIPARTSLRSHAPAFMSPTCATSRSCEYAAHASKNASHIATLALDVPFPIFFFFYALFCSKGCRTSSASRDRVINAPCTLPLRGSSPPVPGSIFGKFLGSCWRVDFSSFFCPHTTFFRIDAIINTSLTSSHHQNLLSARHEIVKTRQHTKNGQKWSFLRVSKKRLKMAFFLPVFDPIEKSRFYDINTSSTHQKMGL